MNRAELAALAFFPGACDPIVAPPASDPQVCLPQACPIGVCGLFDDGCGRLRECSCAPGDLCADGATCVPCGGDACAEGACGDVIDACGATLACGDCANGTSCRSGSCAGCVDGAACPEGRGCLAPGACSELRGCQGASTIVRGFEALPPQADSSADNSSMLERLGGEEWLWVPLEEAPGIWRWARVPLLEADRLDPARLEAIPGLPARPRLPPKVAMALGGAELWESDDPDDPLVEPTWALYVPDGAGGFLERARVASSGGFPLAPQFLADGRTAIVAIADHRRLVVRRRSAATAELFDFGPFEELEPGMIRSGEEINDARTLCEGRLLLLEFQVPGEHDKRHVEVEVIATEPLLLGGFREVPLPGVSGLDLSSSDACDRFYQWRSAGLTVWRTSDCR